MKVSLEFVLSDEDRELLSKEIQLPDDDEMSAFTVSFTVSPEEPELDFGGKKLNVYVIVWVL